MEKLNRYLHVVQEMLWPTHCAVCRNIGRLVCEDCQKCFMWIDQRFACPDCGEPYGHLTCTTCEHDWECSKIISALVFNDISSQMVACMKDAPEVRLALPMALCMYQALEESLLVDRIFRHESNARVDFDGLDIAELMKASYDGICFVPDTKEAVLRRGFDHMQILARALSDITGIETLDIIVHGESSDQRKLSKAERASNLENSIKILDDCRGMNVLLIDDVLTTGATLRSVARSLLVRGVSRVDGLTFCRVG